MSHIKEEFEHLKIPLEAIISATNSFSADNCIGKGGFGKVYKGEIVHSKGRSMVAFKRLDRAFGQGNPQFWKEIMMLSVYRHENIVSLLGFCDESDEKILVYEYAPKGSLDLYLKNDDLSWIQRLKICIGAARGLAYLHNPGGAQIRVLHRDIKSSNILLDENWNAKISDFGLSKLGLVDHQFSFFVSNPVGTIGYCDPLYVENGFLTKESDVYSFGVVLFEVLCGRLCVSNIRDNKPLTKLVRESYEENKINEIIHGNLKDGIDHHSLKLFTGIAYQCLKRDHEERPLMAKIVRILETALEYQANPHSIKDVDITLAWKLSGIVYSSQLQTLCLPDKMAASKVMRLVYTNSGSDLLALTSSGIHKLWKWQRIVRNPFGKSTASVVPQFWQPTSGAFMSNVVSESNPAEESASCIALSMNDSYLISTSGGKVSLFNMITFEVMDTFMPPPPAATYLAFHPQDDNIVAIGMEDSTILMYNVRVDEVTATLKGHQKQITGLAFSRIAVLVSSGADAQICIWNTITWEKITSRCLESPPGYPSPLVGEAKVQLCLHNYRDRRVLVVHESQIAIYEEDLLKLLRWWSPRESLSAPISSAVYSCDGSLVFTGFLDGAVGVFDADSLRLQCRITLSAFIPSSVSSNSNVYPVDIASHPLYRNQFALGLSDGCVRVIEPAAGEITWGVSHPQQDASDQAYFY